MLPLFCCVFCNYNQVAAINVTFYERTECFCFVRSDGVFPVMTCVMLLLDASAEHALAGGRCAAVSFSAFFSLELHQNIADTDGTLQSHHLEVVSSICIFVLDSKTEELVSLADWR